MKLRVERDGFADAVSWAARILPQKAAMPVLSGLRLEVDTTGTLVLSGFDYEVSAQVELDVAVSEAGSVLVPGRLLAEIVRSLPVAPIDVETDGTRLVLTCGSARFVMPTLPLDEYPTLPTLPETCGSLGSDAFAAAIASVAVAAGRDDALPVLTGVRIEIKGDQLTLVGCDRYRLAVRTVKWSPTDPSIEGVALVPAKTLADAARSLTAGAEVSLSLSGFGGDALFGLAGGSRRTTTRLIDGEYPKYAALFPSAMSSVATVDTASLIEAAKRVALVASKTSPVRLTFTSDTVTLEAAGLDDAEAAESLPVSYDGEEITIAFNPSYLLDGLAAIDSDEARFEFTTPAKPAVLTGKADDQGNSDYRYLLMPVRPYA